MAIEKTVELKVDAKDGIKQVDELKKGIADTSSSAKNQKVVFL